MSPEAFPEMSPAAQQFVQIWADATSHVLGRLHGSPLTATPIPAPAEAASPPQPEESCWICFAVSGRLSGSHAFQCPRSDAVRMTQLLMSEPLDPTAALDETRADALSEVFRQVAGIAAAVCKSACGGEVQFELTAKTQPEWTPAGSGFRAFAAPQVSAIHWTLLINSPLRAALEAAAPEKPQQEQAPPEIAAPVAIKPEKTASENAAPEVAREKSPETPPAPPAAPPLATAPPASAAPPAPQQTNAVSAPMSKPVAPAPSANGAPPPANLELLLDVQLDASLRFGERQMLLRDILELRPGSVVELDRRIQEPAELLISGRVVAHGEVVIVDGNYGLRITDISHPRDRLKSLET